MSHHKEIMAGWLLVISVCLTMIIGIPDALADGCDDLDSNKTWIDNFEKMNRACEAGDWNTALRHSKELERVCADSPLLNYTIAHIHKI